MHDRVSSLERGDLEKEYAEAVEPLRYQFLFMMNNLVGMLRLSPFEKSAEIVSDLMNEYSEALTKDYYDYRDHWMAAAAERNKRDV